MWSTIIIFDQPGIEIGLKLVERAIDLLPERDPVELVEHSAMKALADSVRLRALGLGAQFGVDEVEVIMQAFTGRRAQERAMGLLAVPRLVSGAGFHRRDDMHQAGMVAARGQHLGNHVLLADLAVGNVLDANAGTRRQLRGALAHAVTKRLGKTRIIEDADLPRRQK